MPPFLKNKCTIAGFFIMTGLLLYLSGLKAPWYFDDFRNIVNNPLMYDLSRALADIFKPRGVAMLSFAVNNALTGMDPTWFRLTNILLHIGAALLSWRILTRIYGESFIALTGGLLFLVHPLQTQAVTYIVQRMAGMAAFFFLLAVYLYIRSRESQGEKRAGEYCYYVGALFCAVLAIWTKQNTIILPLAVLLVDYTFVDRENFSLSKSLRRVAPFLLITGMAILQQFYSQPDVLTTFNAKAQTYTEMMNGREVSTTAPANSFSDAMPLRYFATELIAFWLYIKLFFLPVGQMLDYSWPIVEKVFNWKTIAATTAFALVFAIIQRFHLWNRRLVFGIAWIILTLALESTFIPLDPIFEHRMYLPLLGSFIVAYELIFSRIPARTAAGFAVVILLIFSVLTVSRNALWSDPVAFWHDNAQKVPQSTRIMSNLAKAYYDQGDHANAEHWYIKALKDEDPNSLVGLGSIRIQQGRTTEARDFFERALRKDANDPLTHSYLGTIYFQAGKVTEGLTMLEHAVKLAPRNQTCLSNLAVAYDLAGRRIEAETTYRQALSINPRNTQILLGLGVLLDETGRSAQGLEVLRQALEADPTNTKMVYYFGIVAFHAGDQINYRLALDRLQLQDRNYFKKLENRTRGEASAVE